MIIVSYDFSNNKRRAKFSKFLEQYGERIQYSVFMVKNSPRVMKRILLEVEMKYRRYFENTDSIMIFSVCNGCVEKLVRYGSAKHAEKEVVYLQ